MYQNGMFLENRSPLTCLILFAIKIEIIPNISLYKAVEKGDIEAVKHTAGNNQLPPPLERLRLSKTDRMLWRFTYISD